MYPRRYRNKCKTNRTTTRSRAVVVVTQEGHRAASEYKQQEAASA